MLPPTHRRSKEVMILTGPEIECRIAQKEIEISPWDPRNCGPNSVDLRLHSEMKKYDLTATPRACLDMQGDNPTQDVRIPAEGLVLQPGTLYLGRTIEHIHTDIFVPQVEGRSSVGRLGMQIHVTAGFCDTGFNGTITLEITVVHPLRVYPEARVCQVGFTVPLGEIRLYKGRYQNQNEATASRFHL